MPHQKEEEIKEQMILEAMLIIDSVAFLEKQVNQALGELQEAVNNHYTEDAERIENQIRVLLKKTNDENSHMDDFLSKYKEILNEKKKVLFGSKQKKQIHNGGFSTKQRGQTGGPSIQRISEKEKQKLAIDS